MTSRRSTMMRSKQVVLLSVAALSCGVSAVSPPSFLVTTLVPNNHHLAFTLRGGSSSSPPSSPSPKKTRKKKKKNSSGKAKKAIDTAMKEKDAAEALGDAIRDRADVLREEDPLLQSIDWSISSLGTAMGASDRRRMMTDGGGVQAATTSVLAHYFLKSHGGAHALQSVCSFLATLSGLGAIAFHKSSWGFVLLQRTFMFALIKHVSGLLAAASLAAKAIPKIGLFQARQWMEQLVLDPVSQYVFYTALMLLWLPSKQRLDACWWWKQIWIPPVLVGPILVREIISNLLITSDILVLWSLGEGASGGIQTLLKVSQSIINAVMSLFVSPQVWRSADPAERQAILAKLVGRISLVLEAAVGLLLTADLVRGFFETAFFSGPKRPKLRESLTKLLCVRLYLHFLWVRRKKIGKLAVKLRGGATQLPFWFFDFVYDPAKSMGLENSKEEDAPSNMTWRDYVPIALGIDQ